MTKKNLSFTFIIILSSLFFSACFSPPQNTSDALESEPIINNQSPDLVLGETTIDPTAQITPTQNNNQQQASIPASPSTNQIVETPPTSMPEYKTLTDFKKIDANQVILKTTQGEIIVDLYREKAPLTTANFLDLVDNKTYDGMVFHRVIPDFMAQVGDPLSKDPSKEAMWGTGGPGYKIMDEFDESLKHDGPGVLSMANSGPNTGGSQIFITHLATPWLDGKHAVFGKVSTGLENLMKIQKGDKIISATYQ